MTDGDSLAFHAAAPDGGDARVLLLERRGDRVRVTEWRAGAFTEPGRADESTPAELEARVEAWRSGGWRFSESPLRIKAWLSHR